MAIAGRKQSVDITSWDDYVSVWRALTEFVVDGRLRSAGVSNFQPAHLERIIDETGVAPAVNQIELHPYFVNPAVEATLRHGIAVEAHSPLGHNREPLSDGTIARIARDHERSAAQVILRWNMQHGHIAHPEVGAAGADGGKPGDLRLPALRRRDGLGRRARQGHPGRSRPRPIPTRGSEPRGVNRPR